MRFWVPKILPVALCLPVMVQAHPHVFVDVSLKVQVNDAGMFEGVEVQWTYDDFYSLLLLADMGLDPDGDGTLEQSELIALDGFDLQWVDGFAGDTVASLNGLAVTLGPPEGRGTSVKDGLITTTHFRSASGPAEGLTLKAFDPTFYTAYNLMDPVTVEGPCSAKVQRADIDAAYTKVEELLYVTPAVDAEANYPEVGEAFADTIVLSCPS